MATLTDQGWEQLATLQREVDLQNPSGGSGGGCGACSSADSAWLTRMGSDQFEQQLDYSYGAPPDEWRRMDAFVQTLIDQLDACKGALIQDCVDTTEPSNPDAASNGPECALHYTDPASQAAVSCSFGLPVETPCSTAVACLCGTDPLRPGIPPRAPCDESWLMPTGEVAFTDFCAEGEAAATRSLTDAFFDFAMAHGGQAQASPECDGVPAYY